MYTHLSNLVDRLNDPILVCKFQKFFGIEQIADDDSQSNGDLVDTKKELKYHVNSKFFYYFFSGVTHCGNEIFYILFLPIMAWCFSDAIINVTCIVWAINMYLGQAAKEFVRMPRPSSPPVAKFEQRYELEYGFPSTHAMAAVSISYSFLYQLLSLDQFNSNSAFKSSVIAFAVLLSFCICLSRVYLGMHSFFDIIGGVGFSLALTRLCVPLTQNFDNFIQDNFLMGISFYFSGILICMMYPAREKWSTARADTTLIMGVACGLNLGMTLKYEFGLLEFGKSDISFSLTSAYFSLSLVRILVGVVSTFLVRTVAKKIIITIALYGFNLKRRMKQNMSVKDLVHTYFPLELCYYFFTYSAVSFHAIFGSFMLFEYFDLK